jgi:ATP-dependent Zn protease
MKTAIRRASPVPTFASPALILLALAASSAHAAAYQNEHFSEFETQLKAGQVHEATINKRLRSVRVTLTDGRHVLAQYAPHEEPRVKSELEAKHVPVTVLTPSQAKKEHLKRPVHHKLRYIAGGIVIGVVVIAGGVILYRRRRRAAQGYQ